MRAMVAFFGRTGLRSEAIIIAVAAILFPGCGNPLVMMLAAQTMRDYSISEYIPLKAGAGADVLATAERVGVALGYRKSAETKGTLATDAITLERETSFLEFAITGSIRTVHIMVMCSSISNADRNIHLLITNAGSWGTASQRATRRRFEKFKQRFLKELAAGKPGP